MTKKELTFKEVAEALLRGQFVKNRSCIYKLGKRDQLEYWSLDEWADSSTFLSKLDDSEIVPDPSIKVEPVDEVVVAIEEARWRTSDETLGILTLLNNKINKLSKEIE